jgi:hypothetical protein
VIITVIPTIKIIPPSANFSISCIAWRQSNAFGLENDGKFAEGGITKACFFAKKHRSNQGAMLFYRSFPNTDYPNIRVPNTEQISFQQKTSWFQSCRPQ